MKHKGFQKILSIEKHPYRSEKPIYKGDAVLSTDFLASDRSRKFEELLIRLKANHPDLWYIHFERQGDNPRDLVNSVTNVLYQINRSRPLRRMRITGVRSSCLDTRNRLLRYICDLAVTSFFGAATITSGLLHYHTPQFVEVSFSLPRIAAKNRKLAIHSTHLLMLERFFTESGYSRDSVHIENVTEETYIQPSTQSIYWRISSERYDLLDICYSIENLFHRNIDGFDFSQGRFKLRLSRSLIYEANDYLERPFDKILIPVRFRRYSSFGKFHLDPQYHIF